MNEDNNERRPMPPIFADFADSMTKNERRAALIYLPLHMFILPVLLNLLVLVWPEAPLDTLTLNLGYYLAGLVFVRLFLWKYLRRAFDALADSPHGIIINVMLAFVAYLALSYALQLLLMLTGLDLANPPNNDSVAQLAGQDLSVMKAIAVFIAPLVEEPLFRGGVFGGLRKKGRALAYVVSILLFALYHVWQYAVGYMEPRYLLYMLNYIPASFALAYCYEKTNSIWAPIFFHMLINWMSMSMLTM